MSNRSPRSDRRDTGFTLVELVIAIALGSIIAGVTVAVLITSMNVVNSTNDLHRDATDAGLVATFLYRDAQAAGGTDPVTLAEVPGLGVSASDWGDCEQDGDLVVRFSWIDRADDSVERPMTVTWARLTDGTLMRRACQDGAVVDAALGEHVTSATITCLPGPGCDAGTTAVELTIVGSAARSATTTTLSASVRPDRASLTPVAGRPGPLVLLGNPATQTGCPGLSLGGARTVVLGDALVDAACSDAAIDGDTTTFEVTGQVVSSSALGDPYASIIPAPPSCASGTGNSITGTTVYPSAVSLRGQTTLAAGRHVFCNGVTVEDGAVVDGTDVFIQVVAGDVVVSSGATIDLTAPTSGPYANLLLSTAGGSFRFTGGSGPDVLRGVVHAPAASVIVATESSVSVGALIAGHLAVSGTGTVRLGMPIPTLTVAPATMPTGQVGVTYPSTAIIADGGTGPYTWRSSSLPAGLSLTSGGLLSGTPTGAGTSVVTFTATDATGLAVTADRAIAVNAALAISGPSTIPSGQVGAGYPATSIMASGGTMPYSFSATDLPDGLTISATGVVSGNPTTAGSGAVAVRVTDAVGATATRDYPITVRSGLAIASPASLPDGQVGTAFTSTTVTATGGTAPYAFSAVGLPAGLTISAAGVIGGTPTTSGTSTATVTATDGIGATAGRAYTVTVAAVPSTASANPFTVAHGFQIFVEDATLLSTWEIDGAVATGGDLTFKNYQRIATQAPSNLTVHQGGRPIALLVGGRVDLTASGTSAELRFDTGWFVVGSTIGQTLLTFSGDLHLVPNGVTNQYAPPRVLSQDGQAEFTPGDAVAPGVLDFAAAFSALRTTSTTMAALPTTCASVAVPSVTEAYGNHTITLASGRVNVWNLTIAEMQRINNLDGPVLPGGSTELIINITDSGAVTLPVRYWMVLSAESSADSVIWNFPNASSVSATGSLLGSLLAPNASVALVDVNIDGDVFAKSLDYRPWSTQHARFDAQIPCLG